MDRRFSAVRRGGIRRCKLRNRKSSILPGARRRNRSRRASRTGLPYFRLVEGRRFNSGSSLGPPFVFFVKMSRPIHRRSKRGKGGAFAPRSAGPAVAAERHLTLCGVWIACGIGFSYVFLLSFLLRARKARKQEADFSVGRSGEFYRLRAVSPLSPLRYARS